MKNPFNFFNKPETNYQDEFNKVLDILDQIPCINAGGCGISSLAMSRWLKKNCRINVTFYAYDYGCSEIIDVPAHIFIYFDGKFLDSSGEVSPQYQNDACPLSEKYLLILINHHRHHWNSSFNREKYVPYIETLLDIDLSDVEY